MNKTQLNNYIGLCKKCDIDTIKYIDMNKNKDINLLINKYKLTDSDLDGLIHVSNNKYVRDDILEHVYLTYYAHKFIQMSGNTLTGGA